MSSNARPTQAACSRLDHDDLIRLAALFDSTAVVDHLRARVVCSQCLCVQPCLQLALRIARGDIGNRAVRSPEGTWGGLLWREGRVVDPRRPETLRHTHHRRSA